MDNYLQDHITRLDDISEQTNIDLLTLVSTYSIKQSQYIERDSNLEKSINSYMRPEKQANRAINVMEGYATRKLNYHKPENVTQLKLWKNDEDNTTRKL